MNEPKIDPKDVLSLVIALEPLAVPLVTDLVALFKAHPALTPDQAANLVLQLSTAIHATNEETLALITADQAAHAAMGAVASPPKP